MGTSQRIAEVVVRLTVRGYQLFLRGADSLSFSRQVGGRFTTVKVYFDGRVETDHWHGRNY